VITNPHLVDWYFTKHFESFLIGFDTLQAEWHWYRYEFQARGSIVHCHGTAKLRLTQVFVP